MKISAADVKKLRDQTGAGMMDCKKALVEANGEIEKAMENLRKKGQKLTEKRADRDANEGVVIAKTSSDRSNGIVVRLGCETDFVAKNEDFVAFANKIADIVLEKLPDSTEALLALPFNDELTIGEKVVEQTGVVGEKLEISKYAKIQTSAGEGQVLPYIHMGHRAGVLVALNLDGQEYVESGKNVAMQVAAMRPIALNKDQVDPTMVEKEIEIGKEQARLEGKPEAILDKIAMGRLNKFYRERTLLNQDYVKGNKESVATYLKSINDKLTVTDFKHIELG